MARRIALIPIELGFLAFLWVLVRVFRLRFCPCGNAYGYNSEGRKGRRGFGGCVVHED